MHQILVPPSKHAISATFDQSSNRMVADRHRLAAYHNKHCWQAFRRYQHRYAWTTFNPQNTRFSEFFAISGCDAHLKSEFSPKLLTTCVYEIKLTLSRVLRALAHISSYGGNTLFEGFMEIRKQFGASSSVCRRFPCTQRIVVSVSSFGASVNWLCGGISMRILTRAWKLIWKKN